MYDLSYTKAISQHFDPTLSVEEQITCALQELEHLEPYTAAHSQRVGTLAGNIAKELGLSPQQIKQISASGMLHDIGKSGVSLSALLKPSKLNDEEFKEIKRHPEIGVKLIQSSPLLINLIPGILYHHERFDGLGYPFGLCGKAIPLEARIIAIADSYDAMTSDRAYRKKLSHQTAIAELKRFANLQFDPELVDAACHAFENSELFEFE